MDRRWSDAKSIGSLSQHFFDSDDNDEKKYEGTCNGYASNPGSKSNLLLCPECDRRSQKTCQYRPQTPSRYTCRSVDQRPEDGKILLDSLLRGASLEPPHERSIIRSISPMNKSPSHYAPPIGSADKPPNEQMHLRSSVGEDEEQVSDDPGYLEESEESPSCRFGGPSNGESHCAHCNLSSDQEEEADLICFRCQMSAEEETTSVEGSICPKCEKNHSTRYQTTSSSSEGTKYPVDAVVKIHLNSRSIDADSDDTIESDTPNNRDGSGQIDRLETIVEAKTDTASENGQDSSKINGQPRTKYLNYMIVLLF